LSSSQQHSFSNDFGKEYEICAHTYNSIGKKQGLYAELQGKTTSDIPTRREDIQNVFAFLTASAPEQEAQLNEVKQKEESSKLDAKEVIQDIRQITINKGVRGVSNLAKQLRIRDVDRSGKLSVVLFKQALDAAGLALSSIAFAAILNQVLDVKNSGNISIDEFLALIRGRLNPRRLALVEKAYLRLDKDQNGAVPLIEVKAKCSASKHPSVIQGAVSAADLLAEILYLISEAGSINGGGVNSNVASILTKSMFTEFYSNTNPFVVSDDEFSKKITSIWNIQE
jgi:Ca2+-binding EF-hand superfamily protein